MFNSNGYDPSFIIFTNLSEKPYQLSLNCIVLTPKEAFHMFENMYHFHNLHFSFSAFSHFYIICLFSLFFKLFCNFWGVIMCCKYVLWGLLLFFVLFKNRIFSIRNLSHNSGFWIFNSEFFPPILKLLTFKSIITIFSSSYTIKYNLNKMKFIINIF